MALFRQCFSLARNFPARPPSSFFFFFQNLTTNLSFSNTKKATKKASPHDDPAPDTPTLTHYKFIDTSQQDKSYDSLNLHQLESEYEKIIHQFQLFTSKLLIQRLSPTLLDNLKIDHILPLKQCATLFVKDPLQLTIKPFDPNNFKKIEKLLQQFLTANSTTNATGSHSMIGGGLLHGNPLNLTLQSRPENNELCVVMPKWTTESRDHVTKIAVQEAEEYRKKLRTIRQAALDELKMWIIQKDHLFKAQELVQASFDKFSKKLGDHLELKKKDIHKV